MSPEQFPVNMHSLLGNSSIKLSNSLVQLIANLSIILISPRKGQLPFSIGRWSEARDVLDSLQSRCKLDFKNTSAVRGMQHIVRFFCPKLVTIIKPYPSKIQNLLPRSQFYIPPLYGRSRKARCCVFERPEELYVWMYEKHRLLII